MTLYYNPGVFWLYDCHMTEERKEYLFHRYFLKTASSDEELELMNWLAANASEEEIEALMQEAWTRFQSPNKVFSPQQSENMLGNILQSRATRVVTIRKNWYLRIAAAAAVLALVGSGVFWLYTEEKTPAPQTIQTATNKIPPEIEPAKDKAILTLANGEQIILDDAANGNISNQSGITVIKLNGQLSYNIATNTNSKEVTYNTITTSKGKQYRLVLEDGTSVWLNAASSLRFPVSFPENERRVQLNGEGYFEIAKDSRRPFHVSLQSSAGADKGTVTALGTRFNINNYDNESGIKTTLLDGSVQVSNKLNASLILKPGQQAAFSNDQIHFNRNANIEQVIAWKNELFNFDNETMEDIMRQLTRWYDIDVKIEGQLPDKHYFGSIRRQVKLTEIIAMLEIAGDISFSIEGRNLFIRPR